MSSHTPTPWLVDAMGNIWATDTKVAEMSTQPSQDDLLYRRKSTEEHEANAEHIVKCVNYHDRLVEVLTEMLTDYRDACEEWDSENQEYGLELIDRAELLLKELDEEK